MIPEPQKTYLLELLTTLGPAAGEFVLVGGQALKFVLAAARATKDFDFLLDAIALREKPANVAENLMALDYTVVPESRNFQFLGCCCTRNRCARALLLTVAPELNWQPNYSAPSA
jgi:hypothetical protein